MGYKQNYPGKAVIIAFLSTLLMILYAQFVLGYYSRCFVTESGPDSLGLSFGYSLQDANSFFVLRTEAQLKCYGDFILFWDNIFALIYTAMHICWLKAVLRRYWIILMSVPVLHMLTDWVENFAELQMLDAFLATGNLPVNIVKFGSVMTVVKWIFSLMTYSIILVGIVKALYAAFIKKTA